jgi:AraC-like DNA-binding protein
MSRQRPAPDAVVTVAHPLPRPLNTHVTVSDAPMALRPDLNEGLEVGIVLAGSQERQWQDYSCLLGTGDAWLCNMLEPHAWRPTGRRGTSVSLVFAPEFLGEEVVGDLPWLTLFTVPVAQRPRVAGAAMRRAVLAIGEEMRQEIEEQRRGWMTALRVCLLRLLLIIGRDWELPSERGDCSQARPRSLRSIMPVLHAVQADVTARLSVPEAAHVCGLSVAQFNRIFRSFMGTSFGEFVLRSRVSAAARYLLSTELTTESIAAQTGFADHSHLHRVFVRYYHCTPRQFRLHAGLVGSRGG